MKRLFITMGCAATAVRTTCIAAAATAILAGGAHAAVIPVTGGSADGFFPFENAFDDQPLTDPTEGLAVPNTEGGAAVTFYDDNDGRAAYVDFGADYADVTISDTWYLYRQFGRVANTGTITYWWSPDTAGQFGVGDVVAPDFGFVSGTQPGANPRSDDVWYQAYDGPDVTPAARYLILRTAADPGGTFGYTNGIQELAFTGVIPEPGSLALAGVGMLLLARRRRR